MNLSTEDKTSRRTLRRLARAGISAPAPTKRSHHTGRTEAEFVAHWTETFGRAPTPASIERARATGQIREG